MAQKIKNFELRLGNLEIKKAYYLTPEQPEIPDYHIDFIEPNKLYGKEDEFEWNDDHTKAYHKDENGVSLEYCTYDKSCFKHPETRFAIAIFSYKEKEDFYQLEFVGNRPQKYLTTEELKENFWTLCRIGDKTLNCDCDCEY